jgi:hypothetical protein
MQNLQDLSSETIRKNWIIYKEEILKNNFFYEILWNDLYKKFDLEKNFEIKYILLLRDFIDGNEIKNNDKYYKFIKENDKTLIIKGMDGEERKIIHKLCDKIGLHHKSVFFKNKKKDLYIYLPDKWSFEFTDKNPYSEYISYKNKSLIECDECGNNENEIQIYRSVYIRNYYCEDCLEILSDGYGGKLNCHKFEPI